MNVLYVVGLGPGGSRWMTWEARASALSIVLRARPPTTRPKASARLEAE